MKMILFPQPKKAHNKTLLVLTACIFILALVFIFSKGIILNETQINADIQQDNSDMPREEYLEPIGKGSVNERGEIFDYDANTKTIKVNDITIVAPANINCEWTDPKADWKLCEVVIAVTNNGIKNFDNKNSVMADFKHTITNINMKVYTSPLSNSQPTYQESVLDSPCQDNMIENEKKDFSICRYNVTRYNFNDWKEKTKIDKFEAGKTLGVKLVFRSPISQDAGVYLGNQFNFSISGNEYDVILDPDISACAVLSTAGATYTLTADIIDSTATPSCMEVTANNVVLDCAGHIIDGEDNLAEDGVVVVRGSIETTNFTIKNCTLTDWDASGIYFENAEGNNIVDVTSNSSKTGVELMNSGGTNLTNVITNDHEWRGVRMESSDSCNFINLTSNGNSYEGLLMISSAGLNLQDSVLKDTLYYSDIGFGNTDPTDCTSTFINVTGTEDKPIVIYNSQVTLSNWNNNVSELILCNADNSVIDNLIMDRTSPENNGLYIIGGTENTNVTNSYFKDLRYGILLDDNSENNRFINITSTSNDWGVRIDGSSSQLFENVTLTSNTNEGVYATSSNYLTFSGVTINSNADDGLYLDGNYNIIEDSTISSQGGLNDVGIYIDDDHNIIRNVTFDNNYYGLQLDTTANNNTVVNSTFVNNDFGIYMDGAGNGLSNLIYNNLFNQTQNIKFEVVYANSWNTTQQTGDRIYTNGTEIGGNYWTNSSGTGFSDTCADVNRDGFCDLGYNVTTGTSCTAGVDCGNNVDYLALFEVPPLPPVYSLNITTPTTSNPDSVSSGDNISINFNVLEDGVNITSGVTMNNVTIGGSFATILTDQSCTGTLDCSVYGAEASCNNCSQCNWTTGAGGLTQIDFEPFDSDVGGWTQATFDTDDWSWLGTAPSGSSGTGPNEVYDGGYMYVETSSGYCNNPDTAVLYLSPAIDFDSYDEINISFAYNMIGTTMGTLHIKENSTGSWVSVWSRTGDQGSSWLTYNQNITSTGSGNIAIWADCGNSYTSDFAVDSVNVTGTSASSSCEAVVAGACSSCVVGECETNCSTAGCSLDATQQFSYVAGVGWQVNITVPTFESGLKDLFVNATYSGTTYNDTQTEAIDYGGTDLIPPYFTLIPANASISYGNETLGVDFNATDETAFDTFAVNDSRFAINDSGWLSNNSILAVGVYELNISINDTSGNTNSTAYKVTINQNTHACDVFFNETSPITYPNTFLAWSDCNSAFTLYRNGTVISNNSVQSLGAGTYNFSVQRTDTSNYSNTYDEELFTIDKAVPTGSLTNSTSWNIDQGTEITIGLSESNTGDGDVTYVVYRDGVSKGTGETWTPSTGTYNYLLNTTGGANYTANSSMDVQTLTVNDVNPPSVTINSPLNNVYSVSVLFNVTATDGTGMDSCWYSLDAGANNVTMTNVSSEWTDTNSSMTQGSHTANFYCNDSLNNLNDTEQITFFVDTLAPNLTIISPLNDTYDTVEIIFNITAIDPDSDISSCFFSLDGGNNITLTREGENSTEGNETGSFDLNATNLKGWGITTNGTYLWVTDYESDGVYKYYTNGTYVDFFDTAGVGNANPFAIYTNNTYFWITDYSDDLVYRYWMNGTYTGWNFSTISEGDAPHGITMLDGFFWVTQNENGGVYQYYPNGTYTGEFFDTSNEIALYNLDAIDYDGKYFYVGAGNPDKVYKYYLNGMYTGFSFSTSSDALGITHNATTFWVVDNDLDKIYTYERDLYTDEYSYTNSSMTEGSHNVIYSCNDTIGNWNITDAVYFEIDLTDSTPPYFTTIPENATITYGDDWAGVDFDADDNVAIDNYTVNDSRFTINSTGFLDEVSTLGVEIYLLNITINDTSNNLNSTIYQVTVNQAVPTGSLTNTESWSIESGTEVTIGLSESNSGDGDLTYVVYRDGVSKTTGETWTPGVGTYDYVLNTTGGTNYTENSSMDAETLTVTDNTLPVVSIIYPAFITYSSSPIQLNYSVVEYNPDSCWYSKNEGSTNSSAVSSGINFTGISASEGTNTWIVYCNDTSGNESSDSVYFTVDTIAPNLTINFPLNDTYDTLEIVFNVTSTDVTSVVDSCLFSLDGGENISLNNNAWNLSNYQYLEINLSGGSSSVFFKPDGTRLYLVDNGAERIYQYLCSDPWNVSSCSSDLFISAEDVSPNGMHFRPDGKKLYEIGASSDRIYQYTCSDAWNLSSCNYDNVYISTQTLTPLGLYFKPDGTRLYESGLSSNRIYQYTCTDAWDLSSCSPDLFITPQDSVVRDIVFNYDGIKLYEIGSDGDLIYQYTCSNAWDLSSCSYDNVNISIQNAIPSDIFFKQDGAKLYESGFTGIYEYEIDSPYDYTYTNSSMTEGSHNVTYFCNDTSGNLNITDAVYFEISIVDTTPPYFITIPADDSIIYDTSWNGVDFNATDEKEFDTYVVNDTTNFQINSTGFLNWTGQLAVGNYYVNVTINDTSNNINSTIYNLNITQAIPSGSLSGSSPITYGTAGDVQGSESNPGDGDVVYKLYRESVEVSDPDTDVLGVGVYNYIYNTTGGANYSSNASLDTFALTVNQGTGVVYTYLNNSRENITLNYGNSIWLNGSLITGQFGNLNLTIDGSELNYSTTQNLTYYYTFSSLGTFEISTNYSGNANYTSDIETWYVIVEDNENPTINIVYPPNNTNSTDFGLDVNFTTSDNVAVDSCWWSDDGGAFNVSNPSCVNMTDVGGWVEGVNNVWVYVNDTSGNEARDEITFRIDTLPPYFTSIVDQTVAETDALSYTPTATDDGVGLDSWGINATSMITINSATGEITNTSVLSPGYYPYNVTINDSLGNTNSTIWNLNITSVDNVNPSVSGLTEYPVDGSEYSPGQSYKFNATVTDDNLDTVLIEFDGVNYSTSNTGSVYNFTITNLAVGIYNYNWFANDTYGNVNNSESGTYEVVQNSSYVLAVGLSPSNSEIYGVETTATGSGCPSQLTCNLSINDSAVSNPDVQTLGVGVWNYTYNTTGNANYSTGSVSELLIITQNSSVVYTYLNHSRSNITIYAGNNIWLNGTLQTGEGDIKLYNNGSLINSGSSPLSNLTTFSTVGLYNITTIHEATQNYTSGSETWWVNVTAVPDDSYPQFSNHNQDPVNNTAYDPSTTVELGVDVANTNGTIGIEFESVNYTTTNVSDYFYHVFSGLSAGTYTYYFWGYGNGTGNLYNISATQSYTIAKATLDGSISGGGTFTYPYESTITGSETNGGDGDITYKLYRDGVEVSNPETATFGVGVYDYLYNGTGGTNYTANSSIANITLTIQQNSSYTLSLNADPSWTETYNTSVNLTGSGCLSGLTCKLYKNDTGEITNGQDIVYSAGVYNITYNTTGNTNYSSNSISNILTINKATLTGSLHSNATWTISPGTSVVINFSETNTGDGDVNYTVYRNGTYIGSGETWTPATGVYTYILNTTGGGNYSANTSIDTQVLTVTSAGIPSINFTNDTEANNSFVQRSWIFVNVSVTITNEDTIIFNLYNSSHDSLNSSSFNDSTRTINWTNLTDGQFYYNVTVNNTGGGENSTETRLITLDNSYGNISILIPTEGSAYGNVVTSVNVDVNYSVDETNLDSCWYRLRGVQTIANTTTPCSNGYNNFTMTISNFGYLTLDVYSNDSASNEEYDLVNFYVNQYTGPQQGGGTNTDPTDDDEEDIKNYNVTILCAKVKEFLEQHGNYTYEEKEDLRNSLAIIFGFAIDGQLLNKYLNDYDTYCPDEDIDDTIPDEPTPTEGKKVNYWMFIIAILSILILILILMIIYHKDRLILILNRLRNEDEEKKKHS